MVLIFTALVGFTIVQSSYLISTKGWNQTNAAIPGVAIQVVIIVGALLNRALSKRFRLGQLFLLGVGWQAVCYVGLAVLGPDSDAWFWVFYLALGLGLGVAFPAFQAMCTVGVPSEQQGKVQSVITIATSLGQVFAGILYPMLFDANARGVYAGVPFLVSAGLNLVGMAIFVSLSYPHMPTLEEETERVTLLGLEQGLAKDKNGDTTSPSDYSRL
jgi:MFS-type transporter involved in bile tolerance (Atg22 family)